ncbi:hypothetical protein CRUP_011769, partial [Coryphaenoides rupestris]
MLASQTTEVSLVDLLLRRGADPRAVDHQGHDLLTYAQLSPSGETRAHLAGVHEWNKNDDRLLLAVEHGEVDKVAALLAKKGVSSVKLDGEGKTALHVAATRGLSDCLSVILAHGADLSVTDAAGFTALHLAAKNNHVDSTRKLVQGKCPVEAVDGSGRTALHYAASSGNVASVQLLCEHRSHVNSET